MPHKSNIRSHNQFSELRRLLRDKDPLPMIIVIHESNNLIVAPDQLPQMIVTI